ncbi:Tat proofreading chaperone TorD [Sanguibacter gelidistatuariae]|uniref:Tat proofreading chaperone TorD n=1 Tax=Sanguibacter gelidistatuariae TaxID=1814289 RepID=A0A1G6GQ41_9MICO|nr:molecular chaperone TorD family protein [Sanguibacter gelidistatuariae]SDB84130.1 Tat proofreading chaperone TorD [Sanguibacter gelidistatuariae]
MTRATTVVDHLLQDRAELARHLDRMAAAFTTLSRVLLVPPAPEVLDQLRDADLLSQWPALPSPESRDGINQLLESAQAGEDARDVRRDFNQLFVGPERMTAPPYESVHLSEDKLVFEQETFLVRAAYAAFGLAAPRLNQEPDDHIGLEMGFVAELCVRGLDALDGADELELRRVLAGVATFLDDHLLAWGPQCLTLVMGEATTCFYRGVGSLGLGLLDDADRTFRV